MTFSLVLGASADLKIRSLRMPILYHSVKTVLGPIVSPLEGAKPGPKGQASGRPTRDNTCC